MASARDDSSDVALRYAASLTRPFLSAVDEAKQRGGAVAVFGQRWGGELQLPNARISASSLQVSFFTLFWLLCQR